MVLFVQGSCKSCTSFLAVDEYLVWQILKPADILLHCYSDAALQDYAAAVYLQSEYPNESIDVKFVAFKTCVASIKRQSKPHLELLGAVILVRLSHSILSLLSMQIQCFYWVDSMAVLYWIKNDKPWKQCVGHHIKEIHQLTAKNQWYHCPGILYPADLPSRGTTGEALHHLEQKDQFLINDEL